MQFITPAAAFVHWAKMLLLSCVAFMAPAKPLFVGALVMVFTDAFVGVFASHRRGEPITSAGFRRTVVKLACYSTAIVAGFVFQVLMLDNAVPVAKVVAAAVGTAELKSVLENISDILGMPLAKMIMEKLGSLNDSRKSKVKDGVA